MARVTFETVVVGAIIGNSALLATGLMVDGHEMVFEVAHNSFLGFFGLELGARVYRGGWKWFRRPWNAFDTVVIALSFAPMVLGGDTSLLRLARLGRLARLVHLGRHVSHLRLLRLVRRVDPVLVAGLVLAVAAPFLGSALLGMPLAV